MPGGNGQTEGQGARSGLEGGIKLSNLIPKYDGTTDVSQWLKQLNVARVAARITDVAMVLPAFLRGNAFTVYANLPEEQQRGYQAIEDALTTAFGVDEHVAYRELVTRRWRDGEPVDVFVADLHRLASLSGMSERSVRMAFMNGLPVGIGMPVKSTPGVKTMSLVQVVELARTLMAANEAPRMEPFPEDLGRPRSGQTEVGAAAVDAAPGRARGGQGCPRMTRRRFRCFGCGEEGHMVRNCPQASNTGQDQGEAGLTSAENGGEL